MLLKDGLKTGWGVRLKDGLIAEVGPNESLSVNVGDKVIEAADQVILPGFINGHNHMYNVFSRGISTDAVVTEFSSFLDDYWWPYIENRITPELSLIHICCCWPMPLWEHGRPGGKTGPTPGPSGQRPGRCWPRHWWPGAGRGSC